MKFASIRDISQSPSRFFEFKEPIIITKHGKPIRAIVSMDEEELEDFILAEHFGLDQEIEKARKLSEQGKNISSKKLREKFGKKAHA